MTAIFKYIPRITSENGLSRYLQEIRKYPLLEPKYETELAKKWQKKKDLNAAHIMVTSHLRLVAKIAIGYKGYGLPICELIAEGNIGMLESIKKRLISFKRQALHAYFLGFIHPTKKTTLSYNTKLPSDINKLLLLLKSI